MGLQKQKRKRERKAEAPKDFAKRKAKVGKRRRAPDNETRPDLRVQKLVLNRQSVAKDVGGQAVSRRHLTVAELLGQLEHHNASVRADALGGLGEILEAHPAEVLGRLGPVLAAVTRRASDAERGVRAGFRALLKKLLAAAEARDLQAFLPGMMANVQNAMTHVAQAVRLDALGALELLMLALPRAVATDFWGPCLQHFQDLLRRTNRNDSLRARSQEFLATTSRCCHQYLQTAREASEVAAAPPAAAGGDAGGGCYRLERACLRPSALRRDAGLCRAAAAEVAALVAARRGAGPGGGAPALRAADAKKAKRKTASGKAIQVYAEGGPDRGRPEAQLVATLLDCWDECHPADAAVRAPAAATLRTMAHVLGSVRLLGTLRLAADDADDARGAEAAAMHGWAEPFLQPLARAVFQVFPAAAGPGASPEQRALTAELNLVTAELLTAMYLAETARPPGAARGGKHAVPPRRWRRAAVEFFAGMLADGTMVAGEDDLAGAAPAFAPSPAMYARALSAAAPLIRAGAEAGDDGAAALLAAVAELVRRLAPRAPTFRRAVEGLRQLLQAGSPASSAGDRRADTSEAPREPGGAMVAVLDLWAEAIPKALWELGAASPATSRAALELTVEVFRRSAGGALRARSDAINLGLAPLFVLEAAPTTSKRTGEARAKLVWGPVAALPPAHQRLALDALWHAPGASEDLLRAVLVALLSVDGLDPAVAARGVAAVAHACEGRPNLRLSALLTLLAGLPAAPPLQARLRRELKAPAAAGALYWARHGPLLEAALVRLRRNDGADALGTGLLALRRAVGAGQATRRGLLGYLLARLARGLPATPVADLARCPSPTLERVARGAAPPVDEATFGGGCGPEGGEEEEDLARLIQYTLATVLQGGADDGGLRASSGDPGLGPVVLFLGARPAWVPALLAALQRLLDDDLPAALAGLPAAVKLAAHPLAPLTTPDWSSGTGGDPRATLVEAALAGLRAIFRHATFARHSGEIFAALQAFQAALRTRPELLVLQDRMGAVLAAALGALPGLPPDAAG